MHAPHIPTFSRSILSISALFLLGLLALSGWSPYDRMTWVLEVIPVIIVLVLLVATYRRFPLTPLLYVLVFIHACVLMYGGAYSYARAPLGFEIAQWLGMERNPYDKIGHFIQGFVPAIAAREILLRGQYVKPGKMLTFLVICVVLAISASYELIEWASALVLGQGADEFLGTQGYEWDTQSDMFYALIGSVTSLALLSRVHDKQLKNIASTSA